MLWDGGALLGAHVQYLSSSSPRNRWTCSNWGVSTLSTTPRAKFRKKSFAQPKQVLPGQKKQWPAPCWCATGSVGVFMCGHDLALAYFEFLDRQSSSWNMNLQKIEIWTTTVNREYTIIEWQWCPMPNCRWKFDRAPSNSEARENFLKKIVFPAAENRHFDLRKSVNGVEKFTDSDPGFTENP